MTTERVAPPGAAHAGGCASTQAGFDPAAVRAFTYDDFSLDLATGQLECRYRLDEVPFVERVQVAPSPAADPVAAHAAARLVFLLAGVSYYKAAAPPVIDLGPHALTAAEAALLRAFYVDGLGEYAHRNGLDLRDVELRHRRTDPAPVRTDVDPERPLVPFGGGLDSIVTVEEVRGGHPDAALFVLSRLGDRFPALEAAASVTGLPARRAGRELDPKILRSAALGYRNGHVPVTGVLSAIAVLVAVLDQRGAVVMSNEWSASSGNLVVDGHEINHQWSKSETFEGLFRAALADSFADPPQYFSLLRPFSELAIARRFAALGQYHPVFRSCNRAFQLDANQRAATWCGTCDKCCFIDVILAPFLSPAALAAVFGGREPLTDPALLPALRALVDLGEGDKPFECVGEVTECRAAVHLAATRPDRAGQPVLATLTQELAAAGALPTDHQIAELLAPIGDHHIPARYAPGHLLR